MEVLACNLRAHPDLLSIKIPNSTASLAVVSLYADDTSAIVTSDPGIRAVFDTYSRFEKASGSKLNLGRCWLGSWKGRSDSPVAIDCSCTMIKVLGIFIGFGDMVAANWNPRIESVSKCFSSWKMRFLYSAVKAIVANALALSRIWYVASLMHMPRRYLMNLPALPLTSFGPVKKI